MSIYDMSVEARDGSQVSLSEYRGRVLLVVNTATGCGFTPQYEDLERIYAAYRDRGLEILDFPCNQFRDQAPGTDEEIHQFCTVKYGTEFPQFHKIDVNGPDAAPLFDALKRAAPGVLGSKGIKWNFTKFLVDRTGTKVERFAPTTSPDAIGPEIEKLL